MGSYIYDALSQARRACVSSKADSSVKPGSISDYYTTVMEPVARNFSDLQILRYVMKLVVIQPQFHPRIQKH